MPTPAIAARGHPVAPAEGARPPELSPLPEAAAALGLSLDQHRQRRLQQYLELLTRWNRVYNLTAVRDPAQMLTHHLLDCLAVVVPLRRQLAAAAAGERPSADGPSIGTPRILDAGSGGGLPGAVLAIMEPGWSVTCVDLVGKKAAFVKQVAAELQLPGLRAVHGRVERMEGAFDVIVSRAFASLDDFVRLTRPRLANPGGQWMAMKGRRPDDEIAALPADIEVFHVEPLAVPGLQAQRCLVWMRPRAAAGEGPR